MNYLKFYHLVVFSIIMIVIYIGLEINTSSLYLIALKRNDNGCFFLGIVSLQ